MDAPVIRTIPVSDVLGHPWVYDIELTEGTFLLFVLFVITRVGLGVVERRAKFRR
jgi:hypothetical protein